MIPVLILVILLSLCLSVPVSLYLSLSLIPSLYVCLSFSFFPISILIVIRNVLLPCLFVIPILLSNQLMLSYNYVHKGIHLLVKMIGRLGARALFVDMCAGHMRRPSIPVNTIVFHVKLDISSG